MYIYMNIDIYIYIYIYIPTYTYIHSFPLSLTHTHTHTPARRRPPGKRGWFGVTANFKSHGLKLSPAQTPHLTPQP